MPWLFKIERQNGEVKIGVCDRPPRKPESDEDDDDDDDDNDDSDDDSDDDNDDKDDLWMPKGNEKELLSSEEEPENKKKVKSRKVKRRTKNKEAENEQSEVKEKRTRKRSAEVLLFNLPKKLKTKDTTEVEDKKNLEKWKRQSDSRKCVFCGVWKSSGNMAAHVQTVHAKDLKEQKITFTTATNQSNKPYRGGMKFLDGIELEKRLKLDDETRDFIDEVFLKVGVTIMFQKDQMRANQPVPETKTLNLRNTRRRKTTLPQKKRLESQSRELKQVKKREVAEQEMVIDHIYEYLTNEERIERLYQHLDFLERTSLNREEVATQAAKSKMDSLVNTGGVEYDEDSQTR
ncbi:uncharacterized protein LOC127751375 [Frankliniella occidentalis]|uniref:Uncharacterized protein LOC127751375 n=1 Tax=Frankliniella occidentalis TaxID=133901 RepID=A0A9C6XTU5_FRAOC|nr:uncharacterized protein LOC127751375 [Frankliniella occidentalis]